MVKVCRIKAEVLLFLKKCWTYMISSSAISFSLQKSRNSCSASRVDFSSMNRSIGNEYNPWTHPFFLSTVLVWLMDAYSLLLTMSSTSQTQSFFFGAISMMKSSFEPDSSSVANVFKSILELPEFSKNPVSEY